MIHEASRASASISWVREDLDDCLALVRENLEEFAEDTSQRAPLVTVQEELERLNLTFLTMEQQGASILTDEMIAVGGYMLHDGDANMGESLNALTDAVIVLPSYLDRLQAGHEDLPILLLPTLNELRASYDESLMSEGALFAPELDVMIPELSGSEADAIATSEFESFARRVRSMYQTSLLGWLKEQSKDSKLEPMQKVCRTLYIRLHRNELRRLWWIAEMAMQGLRDGAIDNDLPLRRLFARLDLTLKAMIDGGEQGPANDTITALSRALLFYAAQAQPGSKGTDILRERFSLEDLIPDRDALLRARGAVTGRDAGLFESIGEAVREELNMVKDTLDMELRTGRVDEEQREHSVTSLRQLSDTLQMLNLPVPAKAVEDLLPALEDTENAGNQDLDSPLLALAQKLLEVEAILDIHIQLLGEPVEEQKNDGQITLPPQEQRQIFSRVLDECVSSLNEVQDAIRNRLEGHEDADYSGVLFQIAGALSVAGQIEVAALTGKLERALNAALAGGHERIEDVPHLNPLTDAVAALELYLTGCRDEQSNSLQFLEIMHSRLEGLPEASESGDEVAATSIELPQRKTPKAAKKSGKSSAPDIDPQMLDIFMEEFDNVRSQLVERVRPWLANASDDEALADIRRGFHTLKGSGRMVGAMEIGDFSWRIEELLNKLIEERISYSKDLGEIVRLAIDSLDGFKARLLGSPSPLTRESVTALSACAQKLANGSAADLAALREMLAIPAVAPAEVEETTAEKSDVLESLLESGDVDPTLKRLMLGEIRGQLSDLEQFLSALMDNRSQPVNTILVRSMHTLVGTLGMAPLGQEADIARALEHYLDNRLKSDLKVTKAAIEPVQMALHRFHQRLYVLEEGNAVGYPLDDNELLQQLHDLARSEDEARAPATPTEEVQPAKAPETESAQSATPDTSTEPVTGDTVADSPRTIVIEEGSIISIFLEEANEVLERCDTLLNTWRDKLSDRKLVQNLQREIHTFKGGARMASLEGMGELAHAMESVLEQIASNRLEATVAAVQALEEGCDSLNLWVEQIQDGNLPETEAARLRFDNRIKTLLLPQAEDLSEPLTPIEEPVAQEPAAEPSAEPLTDVEPVLPKTPATERKETKRKKRSISIGEDSARQVREIPDRPGTSAEDIAPGAQIRVAADLMDKLVNYSGEISIYRSRLEQQLGSVRYNLKEVDGTVQRLKEQLRKMDIESEAQMMSRYQSASTKGSTEFDPLELDRFSNMQQLSRALTESVSDLVNLHDMLDESVRQAESLLTHQSRVSSDMQEGLMQTRMTPFGSAAPRLRRVVRMAAAETGKKARLQLRMAGSSDQLDRNVLERITAPLEHMLRNAIAHGIEVPKVRRKAKKPEEGSITVTVEAEATEFVIRVEDDGAGINLDAVRKRAVERGMMGANEKVDPHRLVQFIRDSGFSTSTTVTGLAGRGVGMDVVNSEIKQIGGSMEIDTEAGKGTRFTIRIPFSLAVMQAIGVSVADRPFQIPLNSVAGVARVTPTEYAALLNSESPSYEFAGETFPVLHLEPLLDAPPIPLDSDNVSLLMIRSGEDTAAFRVANLQGHQEVVIKPVGPQISSIPGILGGTIAADGQVQIILDMGPLIRRGLEAEVLPIAPAAAPQEQARTPLVMVVDDSITMRKVTSRVLENHSLEIMTAQDGVDAVELLHDRVPDLMLLDIEMPRMDGYELLDHVRADARLRHVPIIMITSRAGQKHRKKARQAGANGYLTKPYQEVELVEKVSEVLELELVPRRSD